MADKDLDRLESDLWWASDSCPWTRSEPNEKGRFAVFPKVPNINTSTPEGTKAQRKLEEEWSLRAQKMHSEQQPVTLEPKPVTNELEARKRRELLRGD